MYAVPVALAIGGLALAAWLLLTIVRGLRERAPACPSAALLVAGLIVVPVLALAGASTRMVADMKAVEACASCHVMDRFVSDMFDTTSVTLAARHFRADSMPATACYSCHTGYGIFGSVDAKKDGLHHWWRYVTRSWEEPIEMLRRYPNATCLACHPAEPMFADSIPLHVALRDSLEADVVTCFMCHGEPHARHAVAGDSLESVR